jgi:hypothetical protein
VAEGIVALAVDRFIFLARHGVAVQAMGGGKKIAAGEMGFHRPTWRSWVKESRAEGSKKNLNA